MKSGRLDLRVTPELKARVEARAEELGQKTTTFVERALESALRVCSCGASGFGDERARRHGAECMYAPEREFAASAVAPRIERPVAPRVSPSALVAGSSFRCPVARCRFGARSPAARCPDHGRTVVPA